MTYNEERLEALETQFELAVAGFDTISKVLIAKGGDNIAELFEPYIVSIMELKKTLAYYKNAVEEEKAKSE